MTPFSETNVSAAISRLATMASKDVREMRLRGSKAGLPRLIEACDLELAARPFDYTADLAWKFEKMAEQVVDMDLPEAIKYAFGRGLTARDYEVRLLRWIAAHPGATYQEVAAAYGKRDLTLVIGHLVYDRYGAFRNFLQPGEDQSSVLLRKDRAGNSVRYWLRPEAAGVLLELGVLKVAAEPWPQAAAA